MHYSQEYKKMLDALPCGIVIYDDSPQGKELYFNDAFLKIIGYNRKEYLTIKDRPFESFVYEDDRYIYYRNQKQLAKTGKIVNCEYRVICKDNSLRWVQLNISTIKLENEHAYFASFVDITKNKEAELANFHSQTRYKLVLESTNTAVFEWDSVKKVLTASPSYHKYELAKIAYSEDFKVSDLKQGIYPGDWKVFDQMLEVKKDKQQRLERALRLKMADGSYRWNRLVCLLIVDENKKLKRVEGALLDINDDMEKLTIQKELIDAIPGTIAIFKVGEQLECLYYKKSGEQISKAPKGVFSKIDLEQLNQKYIIPQDQEVFRTEVIEKARKGLSINANFRFLKKEKSRHTYFDWMYLSATKIRTEEDCPVYYAIMTAPPAENMFYRQIVEDSLTAAIIMERQNGNILFTNQSFRNIFGVKPDLSLAGTSIKKIVSPRVVAELKHQSELMNENTLREDNLVSDTGRYLLVKGKRISWNGIDACLLYMLDQTYLQKRNEALMNLLDDIPGGIGLYELTPNHINQLYLNNGYFRMLGATKLENDDYDSLDYPKLIHPDDIATLLKTAKKLHQNEKLIDLTFRILNFKQQYLWVRLIGKVSVIEKDKKVIYCSFFDVDTQMKNQLDLDKEQAVLHLAMQAARMSSWEYDLKTKTVTQFLNSKLQHGYGTKIENAPESIIKDGTIDKNSIDTYRRLFQEMKKGQKFLQGDVYARNANGKGYWWERIIMTPVYDRNGKHIRSVGTSRDITEQKALENKYQQQIEIFNSANSTNLIGKGLYNLTNNAVTNYKAVTKNAVRESKIDSYDTGMFGTAELFVDRNEAQKFLKLFDRSRMLEHFKQGETSVSYEYQRLNNQGKIYWAKTTGKMYPQPISGEVICFIYTYDIDEQKIAREMIDTVVKVDYDYLALMDCRTNDYIVYAKENDMSSPLPSFHSSNYDQEVRYYAKTYVVESEIEQNIQEMSIENVKLQLENKPTYITYVSVKEKNGKLSRKKLQFSYLDRNKEKVLITRIDVTDIYEREQKQLRQYQEASNAKNNFLANMSHDLRTPMNVIIGLSELAKDELNDQKAMESYINNIQTTGQFLLGLVSDCLDFEKLTAHKMVLHNVPYPYEDFRNSIMLMINPLCQQKKIQFTFSEAAPYTVSIDKVRFEQIFFNVLSNAVKYTPEGGKIEFEVDSHLSEDQKLVICDFYVRDNGIGMSQQFQEKLFEPFEQENIARQSDQQGTGLGLSIVKELVTLMGGTIQIKSKLGKGTTVKIHLDMENVTDEVTKPNQMDKLFAKERLKDKTILLLEDQELNMMIIRKLLEKQGMIVLMGKNGKEGLEIFERSALNSIDMILSDIRMPLMNGLEMTKAIRRLKRKDAKSIPIIAMTANAFEEDVQKSKDAGMNAHLSKPVQSELLFKTIESLLKR